MNRRSFLTATALMPFGGILANTASSRIRIAQLGTSHSHASGKMTALRSLPELYEVVAVAEPLSSRQTIAQQDRAYSGLKWATEAELLSDPSIQAVVVETTLADSPRAALACLRAGKSIHLDKPGSASHADFKALRLEAEQHKLTVQMGYMLRYNPTFQLLFRAHQEGWFGELTEIDASIGKLADAELQETLAETPGHGMFELACHLVDAIVFLLGKPREVHAFATPTGLARTGLPDNQLAVLEYPKTMVTLRCNHGDPFGGPHRRFRIAGTRGAMEIQPLESGRGILYLTEPKEEFIKGENRFALAVPGNRYAGEFQDLAKVLRKQKPLAWSAEHDVAVHATAMRCAGLNPV